MFYHMPGTIQKKGSGENMRRENSGGQRKTGQTQQGRSERMEEITSREEKKREFS